MPRPRSIKIQQTEITRAFGEMALVRRKHKLDRLSPHHHIIFNLIEREEGIRAQMLWQEYQVEYEKDCRTPVAIRTFNSYVARL